jgi:hypothetical protein
MVWRDGRGGLAQASPFSHGSRAKEARLGFIVRLLLGIGAAITGLFVAEDAPNFGVVQGMVTIGVLAALVFVVALWPKRWT